MSLWSSRFRLAVTILAVAALPACGTGGGGGGGGTIVGPSNLDLAYETVDDTMDFPLFLTAPPGDVHRLFVVEKTGRIRVIEDGVKLAQPFLDLSGAVSSGREQGLLGLAFDPQYATNGRFFVSYTNTDGDSRIVRYHVSADPDVADAATATPILEVPQPDPLHNGGMIAFGRDGNLYVAFGDGNGETFDAMNNGQDRTDVLGSILRIDVRGATYAIPAGNPFITPNRPELWNYGLRNPWRFSFDRSTGDLYIGDVGESHREEIDVAPSARGLDKGANYGWKVMEGGDCSDPAGCNKIGMVPPVVEYDHGQGCCVIGGYVYRGSAIPRLRGAYFYGDLCGRWVHSFVYSGGRATAEAEWPALATTGEITSFGEDARGELYVLTNAGAVLRIVQAPALAARTASRP